MEQKEDKQQEQPKIKKERFNTFKTLFIYITMPIWLTICLIALIAVLLFLLALVIIFQPLIYYLVWKKFNKPKKGKKYIIDYQKGKPVKIEA